MTSRERVLAAINHEEPDRAPLDLGGSFVFNPDHNIQPKTSPENIVAAYETGLEFGQYPIQ